MKENAGKRPCRETALGWGISLLICLAAVFCALKGHYFSTSYTSIFLIWSVILLSASLIFYLITVRRPLSAWAAVLEKVTFVCGILPLFPADFIYAFGDDLLNGCILWTLVSSAAVSVLWGILHSAAQRRNGSSARLLPLAGGFLLCFVGLAGAAFGLTTGIRCPQLLPIGVGMLFYLLGRELLKLWGRGAVVSAFGLLVLSTVCVLPMLG